MSSRTVLQFPENLRNEVPFRMRHFRNWPRIKKEMKKGCEVTSPINRKLYNLKNLFKTCIVSCVDIEGTRFTLKPKALKPTRVTSRGMG